MLERLKKDGSRGNVAVFILLIMIFAVLVLLATSGIFGRFGIGRLDFSSLKDLRARIAASYRTSTSSTAYKNNSSSAAKFVPKTQEPVKPKPAPTSTISPSQIPTGFTLAQLSPYFKKINIGSVSPGSYNYYGSIYLYTSLGDKDAVDVTGWSLRGKNGSQFISKAVEVYDPSGLSAESDIVLKKGDYLNIYTSVSSIGRNLRLNVCTGYLENVSKFIPSLPRNCPRPPQSDLENFSGRCYDYILSLGTCSLPSGNPLLPINDYGCRAYLDKINYKGCFEKYRQTANFLSHEWRVWTGSRFLDDRHDRVLLFDKNGLLVDARKY